MLQSSQSRRAKTSAGNQLDARCAPPGATDCVPPRPRRAPVAAPTAGASAAQQGQNHQQNHKQYHKRDRKQCLKNQKEDLKKAGLNEKEVKSEFVKKESYKTKEVEY